MHAEVEVVAVGVDGGEFVVARLRLAGHARADDFQGVRPFRLGHQGERIERLHLLGGVAEDLGKAAVDVGQTPVLQDVGAGNGLLDNAAERLLAFAQVHFGAFALADVHRHQADPDDGLAHQHREKAEQPVACLAGGGIDAAHLVIEGRFFVVEQLVEAVCDLRAAARG